jgi:4-hydroxybenzoate polyprenyltransferase
MTSKYIRLLRPKAWITFLFPFTVGLGLGITSDSYWYHIIFSFIAFICWMSFSFILNSIADKDVDRLHDGRSKDMNLAYQPIATGEISDKYAFTLSIIFLSLSILFAWFIHPIFFILIFIVNGIGYVYSMPPFRFKATPVGDILCNTIAGGLIFIAGLSIGGANMNPLLMIGAFIMGSIFYIPTVVTDYEFDKKAGLKTSAVYFSPKKMVLAMIPLTLILIIISLFIFLTSNIELRLLAIIIIFYSIPSTIVVNMKLVGNRLFIHENWILVPFVILSIIYVVYGILKLFGLIILNYN